MHFNLFTYFNSKLENTMKKKWIIDGHGFFKQIEYLQSFFHTFFSQSFSKTLKINRFMADSINPWA